MQDTFKALIEFAAAAHVGWWELIGGICLVILAARLPALSKIASEFINERRRINGSLKLQQDQTRRRLEAARARRKKVGQTK